jgi:cytoskeletal protein CcmA (bactofilin family)
LLGRGTEFEGKLTFEGTVRVDGKFTGEIHTEGMLVIGEKAVVQAEIQAGVVMVKGEARGTIRAQNRIEAYAPARIYGDLHAPVLVLGEGVVFHGTSRMTDSPGEGDKSQNTDSPKNDKIEG